MANKTPRHLHPGDQNLKGKKSKSICHCCSDMVNHKEKILENLDKLEIRNYPLAAGTGRAFEA